jgi:hypothetical protein
MILCSRLGLRKLHKRGCSGKGLFSIWSTPPSYPNRSRCQREVLDAEKAEGARIVAEYRAAEQLAAENDLGARQSKLEDSAINPYKKLSPVEIQTLQEEIRQCNHGEYLVALQQQRELRDTAADLAKTILARLVKSFDEELRETAWQFEEQLAKDFIPLSNHAGDDFEAWHTPHVVARHAWRELAKSALRNMSAENAVGSIQFLATSEERVPLFPWF